jgi:hypothetical protein
MMFIEKDELCKNVVFKHASYFLDERFVHLFNYNLAKQSKNVYVRQEIC